MYVCVHFDSHLLENKVSQTYGPNHGKWNVRIIGIVSVRGPIVLQLKLIGPFVQWMNSGTTWAGDSYLSICLFLVIWCVASMFIEKRLKWQLWQIKKLV